MIFFVLFLSSMGFETQYVLRMPTLERHQEATDPLTKPTDLGRESACKLLSSSSTNAIYVYYLARNLVVMLQ